LQRNQLPEARLRIDGTTWYMRREKGLTRRIESQPLQPPQISHGGCHMVAKNNGLSKGFDKPLFLRHVLLRRQATFKTLPLLGKCNSAT